MKRCCTCKEIKPVEEFYRQRKTHDGLQGQCRPCGSASLARFEAKFDPADYLRYKTSYHLKRKYGISLNEYERILLSQGGGCAICGDGPAARRLVVDHDHLTGAIRGILCHRCNVGLGNFGDNPKVLVRALEYLS